MSKPPYRMPTSPTSVAPERRERGPAGLVAAIASAALLAIQGIVIAMALLAVIVIAAAVLGGCSAMPTIGKTEIVRVKEEVPVKCVVKEVKPMKADGTLLERWPLDEPGVREADVYTLAGAALAEVELRIAYQVELLAANKACQ